MTRYMRPHWLAALGIIVAGVTIAFSVFSEAAVICPPGTTNPAYCEVTGSVPTDLAQQQQAAQQTQQLLTQVSSPVVKQAVTSVLVLSNSLASLAQTLIAQVAQLQMTNPAAAAALSSAAVAAAQGAAALARAAQATVQVTLHVQNAAIKRQVTNGLELSRFYASQAAALLRQAQAILGRVAHARVADAGARVTPAQLRRAKTLIKKAQQDTARAYKEAQNARQIAANAITPKGQVGDIYRSVKMIVTDYDEFVAQTVGLEAHVRSRAIRRKIDALLGRAKRPAGQSSTLFSDAVLNTRGGQALTQIAVARAKVAAARAIAARARGVATHAVHKRR